VRRSLTAFWLVAGSMHFIRPRFNDAIEPPPLDEQARAVTYASGVAELAGAAALLAGRPRLARWWLLAVLAAVYPANVRMALRPQQFRAIPRWALWARLPVQGLFALHVLAGTKD
jgi:uncharacterized membrane protein